MLFPIGTVVFRVVDGWGLVVAGGSGDNGTNPFD
jgi:hypothetical protein